MTRTSEEHGKAGCVRVCVFTTFLHSWVVYKSDRVNVCLLSVRLCFLVCHLSSVTYNACYDEVKFHTK